MAAFDSNFYLNNNPDVAQAIANRTWTGTPEEHFKQFGINEGRAANSENMQYNMINEQRANSAEEAARINAQRNSRDELEQARTEGRVMINGIGNERILSQEEAARRATDLQIIDGIKTKEAKTDWLDLMGTVENNARQTGYDYLDGLGISGSSAYDDLTRQLENRLAQTRANIPELSANPENFYDPTLASSIVGKYTSGKQSSLRNEFNSKFNPELLDKYFSDSIDDPYIDEILNEQYNSATSILDRGQKRGTLNETGYSAAMDNLAKQRSVGQAKLNDVSTNLRTSLRGEFEDQISKVADRVNNYQLGQEINISPDYDRITSGAQERVNNYGGELRNALGGEQLFDTSFARQTGGSAQGAQNIGNPALISAVRDKNKQLTNDRGLKSQGSF